MIVDKNNNEVKIGSYVKVLFIDPGFISTFSDNEARIMMSMINKTFEVTEFAHGKAMVHQSIDARNSFGLVLDSSDMELVIDNI